jgi:glycosyltransferase involved in cell wall biosynthesis
MAYNPKVSIVMTSYNRKIQTYFTLYTISQSTYTNIEVIIIDDNSDPDNIVSIEDLNKSQYSEFTKNLDIKIKVLNTEDKTWINPCIAYNIGFKMATGDIIIIQNSEVCHIGDCISYVVNNLKLGDWLTLNCYGLGNFNHNNTLCNIYDKNNTQTVHDYILSLGNRIGGNSIARDDVHGWLNNSQSFFTAYHYFGAIYKSDLLTKMNGGFCEEYKDGLCLDDVDFIKYLIYNNFKFKSNNFSSNNPFVIHQYHTKPQIMLKEPYKYFNINKKIFEKRMNDILMNTHLDIHSGFNMPTPILIS